MYFFISNFFKNRGSLISAEVETPVNKLLALIPGRKNPDQTLELIAISHSEEELNSYLREARASVDAIQFLIPISKYMFERKLYDIDSLVRKLADENFSPEIVTMYLSGQFGHHPVLSISIKMRQESGEFSSEIRIPSQELVREFEKKMVAVLLEEMRK